MCVPWQYTCMYVGLNLCATTLIGDQISMVLGYTHSSVWLEHTVCKQRRGSMLITTAALLLYRSEWRRQSLHVMWIYTYLASYPGPPAFGRGLGTRLAHILPALGLLNTVQYWAMSPAYVLPTDIAYVESHQFLGIESISQILKCNKHLYRFLLCHPTTKTNYISPRLK